MHPCQLSRRISNPELVLQARTDTVSMSVLFARQPVPLLASQMLSFGEAPFPQDRRRYTAQLRWRVTATVDTGATSAQEWTLRPSPN